MNLRKPAVYRCCLYLMRGVILSLFLASAIAQKSGDTSQIGKHRQLFIDDHLIESSENVNRRLIPAKKSPENPILVADEPWENRMAVPQGSVIFDEEAGVYKLWYTTDIQSKGKGLAYATSDDGLIWEKPELDIVLKDGKKTNLVIPSLTFGYMYQPYCVLKDLRETDPARRYKLAFLSIQRDVIENESPHHPSTRRGLGIAFSPDGLRWTKVRDFASDEVIDISHVLVDPNRGHQFVIYGRTLKVLPEIREAWSHHEWFDKHYNGRSVVRASSDDFLNWSPTQFILGPDLQDPVSSMIYSMNVFAYEGIYLGLVQRYISKPGVGTIDLQLAISRDGIHFERPFRNPFIELGGIGSWDRFMLHPMSGPPLEKGDELRFYYGGRNYRHRPTSIADEGLPTGSIGMASITRDRFVAVEASYDGGTLITKPIVFNGSRLSLNGNTSFGEIEVQILDASNNPIDGYTSAIQGVDQIDCLVSFPVGSLEPLLGRAIRLKFTLKNAQLYSFRFQ